MMNSDGVHFLKQLQAHGRVHVLWSKRESYIKVSGDKADVAKAVTRIGQYIADHHQTLLRLPMALRRPLQSDRAVRAQLDDWCKQRACKHELSRHALIIRGNEQKVLEVVELVRPFLEQLANKLSVPVAAASDCPICFCEVENPYALMACGHQLCRVCAVDSITHGHQEVDPKLFGVVSTRRLKREK